MSLHISWIEERTSWRDIPPDVAKVRTHCCHCIVSSVEARFRKLISNGGYVVTQEVQCREDCGCFANPRKRIGKWNRPAPEYED